MKEDYVSYGVAKLLKEKGFNEPIRCWYDSAKDFHERGVEMRNSDCISPTIMCPTHQMAMKWLREEHGVYIVSDIRIILEQWAGYDVYIYIEKDGFLSKKEHLKGLKDNTSFEKAVEAALKYSLENLI